MRLGAIAAILLSVLSAGATATPRESPYKKIKNAVTRQAFGVASTSVIQVAVGGGFGQEFTRDLQFGLSYRYHLSPFIGLGLTVLGGLSFESGLVGEIRGAGRPELLNNVRPETMRAVATVDFHLVPIYGKFVLFGRYAVHYDLTLTVGVGVAAIQRKMLDGQTGIPEGGTRGALSPTVGASLRLLFSRNIGLFGEFRDFIWSEENAITRQRGISNHYSVTIGPAFVF